ncbi:NB-ARC domain-containing protein [Actinospica robiniae]|uniref:NB-ARC domain protein n=1 Tax=Actinospica robiniae DSM 44927 TaxID=479430 RepID=W9DWE5_9ACTN|nr:NB-ARC domain-containing protein [Actinospica robiniae]ETA71149.1 NB-ARC domain protein [Actinospica robiniae DSM 44927]
MRSFKRRRSARARRLRNGLLIACKFFSRAVLPLTFAFATRMAAKTQSANASLRWWILATTISFLAIPVVEWLARRTRATVAELPERPHAFYGREDDMRALDAEYRAQGGARHWWRLPKRRRHARSPVRLYLHGQPGVGKGALLAEYAHRIARHYPHGVFREPLSEGGVARPPDEILNSLLDKLKANGFVNQTAAENLEHFRKLTHSGRYLIILESALSANQIEELMPDGLRCAVLVTSGRDIAETTVTGSHLVKVPTTNAAWDIFCSVAGDAARSHPECVAEIIELCGCLPLALLAAAAQLADRKGIANPPYEDPYTEMAATLRKGPGRLGQLNHGAMVPRQRIEAEYARLGELERRAFRFLALLETETFLPWVLSPLLEVTDAVSANLIGRLARAQLIEVVGQRPGPYRYTFHPLVRDLAHTLLMDENAADMEPASARFEEEFLAVAVGFLLRRRPLLVNVLPVPPTPERMEMAGSAEPSQRWVRAEYANLVRASSAAHRQGEWALSWRIAALLGGCVPLRLAVPDALEVFELAHMAAVRDAAIDGEIEVLIAKGSYLVSTEDYNTSFETLEEAMRQALASSVSKRSLLAARIHREMGLAWLQLGAYSNALPQFSLALSEFAGSNDPQDQRLIGILSAETESARRPERWLDNPYTASVADGEVVAYRLHLGRSEAARRAYRWEAAEKELHEGLTSNLGDARRRASIQYRLARLALTRYRNGAPRRGRAAYAEQAIQYAATSLLRFQYMPNPIGEIRARCMLASALLATGRTKDALYHGERAQGDLVKIGLKSELAKPLFARVGRLLGQVRLADDDPGRAKDLIAEAARRFKELDDFRSYSECKFLMGVIQYRSGDYIDARLSLAGAHAYFAKSGDTVQLRSTLFAMAKVDYKIGKKLAAADHFLEAMRHRRAVSR